MEAPTPTRPSDGVPRRAGKRVRTMGNKIKIPPPFQAPLSRLSFFNLRKQSSMRAVDVTIDDGWLKLWKKGLSTSQWNDLVDGLSDEQCAAVTK